jgi:hypothetical protein
MKTIDSKEEKRSKIDTIACPSEADVSGLDLLYLMYERELVDYTYNDKSNVREKKNNPVFNYPAKSLQCNGKRAFSESIFKDPTEAWRLSASDDVRRKVNVHRVETFTVGILDGERHGIQASCEFQREWIRSGSVDPEQKPTVCVNVSVYRLPETCKSDRSPTVPCLVPTFRCESNISSEKIMLLEIESARSFDYENRLSFVRHIESELQEKKPYTDLILQGVQSQLQHLLFIVKELENVEISERQPLLEKMSPEVKTHVFNAMNEASNLVVSVVLDLLSRDITQREPPRLSWPLTEFFERRIPTLLKTN